MVKSLIKILGGALLSAFPLVSSCSELSIGLGSCNNYVDMQNTPQEPVIRQKAEELMKSLNPMDYRKAAKCYQSIGDKSKMGQAADAFFKATGDPWVYRELGMDNQKETLSILPERENKK